MKINPGVVAAIHVAGVRGAVRYTTPGLFVRILNSVFFKFLNYSVTLTRYRPTP